MSAGAIPGDQGPDDYADVLQLDDDVHPAIPVKVEGTVPVAQATAPDGNVAGKLVTNAQVTAVKLLNADATRGRTTLVGGASFYLGFSKDQAEGKVAKIPANVPIVITNGRQIWVMGDAADSYVTAIVDQWVQ